jgi:hypothetical protein
MLRSGIPIVPNNFCSAINVRSDFSHLVEGVFAMLSPLAQTTPWEVFLLDLAELGVLRGEQGRMELRIEIAVIGAIRIVFNKILSLL